MTVKMLKTLSMNYINIQITCKKDFNKITYMKDNNLMRSVEKLR